MKVIYLDCDGVLATLRAHLCQHGRGGLIVSWDQDTCQLLRTLGGGGVRYVISSTWRYGPMLYRLSTNLYIHQLTHYLYSFDQGVDYTSDHWRTPIHTESRETLSRGGEIDLHLKAHPDITDYRIIDDDSDMLEHQLPRFIHTKCHDGLSAMQVLDLLKWAESS